MSNKIITADGEIWLRHFNKGLEDEFLCRCGKCGGGAEKMRWEFLLMLDNAREISGVPYILNRGYSCPVHNRNIGSVTDNHPSGQAADIRATDSVTRGKILVGAYTAGFERVGIHRTFIHLDNREIVPPVTAWYYQRG